MKTIFKLSMIFLAVALIACRKDNPENPEPPATFDGFSIDDDGWIESPQWLADITKKSGLRIVYLFQHNGENYICLDNPVSSSLYNSQWFFTLSGELAVDYDMDEYPPSPSEEVVKLWWEMHESCRKGILIWRRPSKNTSASTRADQFLLKTLEQSRIKF